MNVCAAFGALQSIYHIRTALFIINIYIFFQFCSLESLEYVTIKINCISYIFYDSLMDGKLFRKTFRYKDTELDSILAFNQ